MAAYSVWTNNVYLTNYFGDSGLKNERSNEWRPKKTWSKQIETGLKNQRFCPQLSNLENFCTKLLWSSGTHSNLLAPEQISSISWSGVKNDLNGQNVLSGTSFSLLYTLFLVLIRNLIFKCGSILKWSALCLFKCVAEPFWGSWYSVAF